MPVHNGRDSTGPFYQWGSSGKKYRYPPRDVRARSIALAKASRQGRAVQVRRYGVSPP